MKHVLTLWAKRAIPALVLAVLALTACEKEPVEKAPVYRAPYEKELRFNHYTYDSIQPQIVTKFARDTACKHIYLVLLDNNNYTNMNENSITNVRNYLDKRIQLAPDKISGRGDFYFSSGEASVADSLWFVQHGWTIRQMANHR